MPTYDYRCKQCQYEFSFFYKTYADYDAAVPACPQCDHTKLSKLISKVALPRPSHTFDKMSANEMLSVLESGDSKQVGAMFDQVGGASPELGAQYHETTQRLLKGESMDKVEKDLRVQDQAKSPKKKKS